MDEYEPHLAIAAALGVGLLVGLEREQAHPKNQGALIAGIRTYPIVALIGALATLVGPWLSLVALAGVFALVAISYTTDVRAGAGHGVTTEAAAIATFLLGALATSHGVVEPISDRLVLVVALGVTLTFLLSSKQWLHGIASKVSREDFYATVKFLIVAAIVLPLLPHRKVGPLEAIDPFTVGLMVVTIAGLSFVGYVATRWLGPNRGLLVGAAAGGLVSSTAVTVAFSHRAKDQPELAPAAAGAIAMASGMMIARIAVLVAVVHLDLLAELGPPLVGSLVGAVVGGLIVYRKAPGTEAKAAEVENPFELASAIKFGLVFAAILIAINAAKVYLGTGGVFAAAGVAGLTDVDAVTLSTAKLGGLSARSAAIAILIAAGTNTLVKAFLTLGLGGRGLGMRVLLVAGLMVVGGAAGLAAWAL